MILCSFFWVVFDDSGDETTRFFHQTIVTTPRLRDERGGRCGAVGAEEWMDRRAMCCHIGRPAVPHNPDHHPPNSVVHSQIPPLQIHFFAELQRPIHAKNIVVRHTNWGYTWAGARGAPMKARNGSDFLCSPGDSQSTAAFGSDQILCLRHWHSFT